MFDMMCTSAMTQHNNCHWKAISDFEFVIHFRKTFKVFLFRLLSMQFLLLYIFGVRVKPIPMNVCCRCEHCNQI